MATPKLTRVLERLREVSAALPTRATAVMRGHVPRPLLDAVTLARQGVLRPVRPDKLLRMAQAWRRWGITPHLGYSVGAVRHPDRTAVIDERGALSFAEVERRTTRLAHGLHRQGAASNTRVAVLCRNHHGLLETILACGKIGADVVLLNTSLSARQLCTLIAEHRASVVVADSEFAGHLTDLPADIELILAWTDGTTRHATLEHLIGTSPAKRLPKPPRHARMIVLTSGTTGSPKGARRPDAPGLSAPAAILSRVPLHSGERMLVAAPMFHTWGLAAFQLGSVLGATLVLRRKFDPQQALSAAHRHQCTSIFAVPVMLQRILELPEKTRKQYKLDSLRIVACSGSALPAGLAAKFQRTFGPILYNLYGSTEVSWVTIASPHDLHHAPGTSGRPPRGTTLRILDEEGKPVRNGSTGRVFVGNNMLFEGYTHGTTKDVIGGLMSTGDLGYLDPAGRLCLVGREDDMIVSGGENVYPKETEDALATMPEVAEVAVTGVDDVEFGQRLAAFVALHDGCELDAETVRERLRGEVSKFALPRDVVFVDALPRNALGKVVPRDLPSTS